MAVVNINSNISALSAQRRLADSSKQLQGSFARLSSGLRINRASDDAAGLAVSSSLNVDRRVYAQGVRNLNDGISASSIADSAVETLSSIVIRLEELAEQAANGTLSQVQRRSLNAEGQALSKEYFRIAKSVSFNQLNLLDGSIQDFRLQGGYGDAGALVGGFGGNMGTGEFGEGSVFTTGVNPRSVTLADLNGDGVLDLVTADSGSTRASVMLGNGDGSFKARTAFTTGASPYSITLGDLNGDGVLDLLTADSGSTSASVMLGNGDGSFKVRTAFTTGASPYSITLGDLNGDGVLDLVTAGGIFASSNASIMLGNGDGSFKARTAFTTGNNPMSVTLGDLNGDGVLDLVTGDSGAAASVMLGNGDGSFKARTAFTTGASPYSLTLGDLNGDGVLDLVTGDYNGASATVMLGNGDGSFKVRTAFTTGTQPYSVILGDLNGDGVLDLVTADYGSNSASVMLGNGDGSFKARTAFTTGNNPMSVTLGDLNGDGVLDLVTANSGSASASVLLASTQSGTSPLLQFSLKTKADALQALPMFKQKQQQLSMQRAEIGAFQSRIEVASNNLQVAGENFAAAASQIQDVDVAEESAHLVRAQILQQAGAAILAQANAQPQIVLKLLNGL